MCILAQEIVSIRIILILDKVGTWEDKVHTFWEGHKILHNLNLRFDHYSMGQVSKSMVEISQNFVAFSECVNFTKTF